MGFLSNVHICIHPAKGSALCLPCRREMIGDSKMVEILCRGEGDSAHSSSLFLFTADRSSAEPVEDTETTEFVSMSLSLSLFVSLCSCPRLCLVVFICFGTLCFLCRRRTVNLESGCNLPKKCSQKQTLCAVRIGAQRLTEERVLTGSLALCK